MALVASVHTIDFATILCPCKVNLKELRLSDMTGYLSDHDPVAGMQVFMVFLFRERDAGPGYFKRARGTSERTGIEDGRNWDSGANLGARS